MDITNDVLKALVMATDQQKAAALRILNGEPVLPDEPKKAEPFLKLKEVSRQLGISRCSLWRWGVPGHDFGGRRWFRMSEVEAYLGSDALVRRAGEMKSERRRKRRSNHVADNG